MNCPACNGKRHARVDGHSSLYTCKACGALHGRCYLGQSHALVHPYFVSEERQAELNKTREAECRYYDIICLGSKGVTRRHGWYDPETKCITQTG